MLRQKTNTQTSRSPEWAVAPLSSPMVGKDSWEGRWLRWRSLWSVFSIGYRYAKNGRKTIRLMQRLEAFRRQIFGNFPMQKIARVDGRYFWNLSAPGYPSNASAEYHYKAFEKMDSPANYKGLQTVFFSITNKCALQCEHCYEWARINRKDQLAPKDLVQILQKIQRYGTDVIFLEGGEPLLNWKGLTEILSKADDRSDLWIITSGYQLTGPKAARLKKLGLTGVLVSLDHYLESAHNQFRGNDLAFEWAVKAVRNANQAGLVTGLSICVTKAFTTEENLKSYLDFARQLGVSFVQFLEPQPAGRYAGQEVQLLPQQQDLLTSFFLKYNGRKAYQSYPILFYPAYHQRQIGCLGAGNHYLFIDADGYVHACPFCQKKTVSALHFPIEDAINIVHELGCHRFEDHYRQPLLLEHAHGG